MTGRNPQESDGGSLRPPSALLPIAQCLDADAHGLRELRLRETYEAPQGGDVIATLDLASNETLARAA
jgi:hypothetical protein